MALVMALVVVLIAARWMVRNPWASSPGTTASNPTAPVALPGTRAPPMAVMGTDLPPNFPPELFVPSIYDRPGGVLHLQAMKAADSGDHPGARAIWQEIIDSAAHHMDRFSAYRSLANSLNTEGRVSEAIQVLRDSIAEFQSLAGGLSRERPFDRYAAEAALRCAQLLQVIDLTSGTPGWRPPVATDLVLDHRELFSPAEIHEALLTRAQDRGLKGMDHEVIALVEESWSYESPAERRTSRWASIQARYSAALLRAGRAGDAAEYMVRLWRESKTHGHRHVSSLGSALVDALRAAHRHDEAIDATWDIVAQIDSHLDAGGLSDFDRNSLDGTRRALLNRISASDAYGRPVDALLAIRRLRELGTDNADVANSFDIAEERLLRKIEIAGDGGR
ncbi:MAG: hypothetical protein KF787_08435 [Phycisphaeraceae bacterium]|nr:hypothetical protein [Phycisphaeraceae bacterium]